MDYQGRKKNLWGKNTMYRIAKLASDDRRALFRNTAAKMHLNEVSEKKQTLYSSSNHATQRLIP